MNTIQIELEKQKKNFANMIALRSAINAAVQTRSTKNPVFSSKKTNKGVLFNDWKKLLIQNAKQYKIRKEQADFIKSVKDLQKALQDKHGALFYKNEVRIAQCQKSLSVYLKWLWCLGEISPEPPVCPIDRNVINNCYSLLDKKKDKDDRSFLVSVNKNGGWGCINSIDDYKRLLDIANKVAQLKEKTVSQWELSFFNEYLDSDYEDCVLL